jgi:hypothetical protein
MSFAVPVGFCVRLDRRETEHAIRPGALSNTRNIKGKGRRSPVAACERCAAAQIVIGIGGLSGDIAPANVTANLVT